MSNNLVADFGVDVGGDFDEKLYLKVKIGKGSEEVMSLKQTVETGTKCPLDDSAFMVNMHVKSNVDLNTLKEHINAEILPHVCVSFFKN